MAEDPGRQTHTTGEVYVHPRGQKYRDEMDRIFGEKCIKCREGVEDCQCEN